MQFFDLICQLFGVEHCPSAHLCERGRVYHVRHSLGGGERKFAVEKCALCELAVFSHARAVFEGRFEYCAGDLHAAVAVQFNDVLARERMGRLEIYAQPEIGKAAAENFARIHVIGCEVGDAHRAHGDEYFFRDRQRSAAAYSYYSHAARCGGGGYCRNAIF